MNTETYQFICKHCKEGYRGLVKFCPNCGKRIRPKAKTWSTEHKEERVYTLPADYPKSEEVFADINGEYLSDEVIGQIAEQYKKLWDEGKLSMEIDYDPNKNTIIEYSVVPKHGE